MFHVVSKVSEAAVDPVADRDKVWAVCMSIHIIIHVSIHMSIGMSIDMSIHMSIYMSMHRPVTRSGLCASMPASPRFRAPSRHC